MAMTLSDPTRAPLSLLTSGGDPRDAVADANDIVGAAIESLPIAAMVVRSDRIIACVNRETERLFGYAGGELIGRPVEALVPDAPRIGDADTPPDGDENAVAQAGACRGLYGRHKDGSEIPIDMQWTPVQARDTDLIIVSIADLSDRHGLSTGPQVWADEQIEFERLVCELGAEFVNLRPSEVDRAIEDGLGRLARTLALDRSALFQIEESGDFIHTHHWTRPGWAPPLPRVSAREQFPWHLAQVRAGELVCFSRLDQVPDATDRENLRRIGTKAAVTVPLRIGGDVRGALTFASVRDERSWTDAEINRMRVVAHILANALARKSADEQLRKAVDDAFDLRDRLRRENEYLRHELKGVLGTPPIVGHSTAVRRVIEQLRQVAPTESAVLLIGETGTGKTLLANHIHELSSRSEHALVHVNCASPFAASMDGELVGSEKGSYVDDQFKHLGRLELANGSTVFLDEVADLSFDAQASLVRVLQDKQIQPLGSSRAVRVDVRVVAATRKDLRRSIEEGGFRDDLYYLLNVFPIHVPPLRERPEDVPLIVWRFVDEFSRAYGKPIDTIDQASMAALQTYSWPGNARELRNVVERAMIVAAGRRLHIPLPSNGPPPTRRNGTLAAIEREHIRRVLASCGGQTDGKDGAAARLGISPRALRMKMAALGIRPRAHASP
jgi:formate hydrogenlyase transcriptional activator